MTTAPESVNGEGRKYAAAVALALSVATGGRPPIDFLHSRLAPPKQRRMPRWTVMAAAAAIVVVGVAVAAYVQMLHQQAAVNEINKYLEENKNERASAEAFVDKVSFARAWHGGDPRFLSCIRDLTAAMPDDGETYATNLTIRESPHPFAPAGSTGSSKASAADVRSLSGTLYGKSIDQRHVEVLQDRIARTAAFVEVKLAGSDDAGRGREVSFSINFVYVPDGRR